MRWSRLLVLVLGTTLAAPAGAQEDAPKPLPPDLVRQWEKVKTEFGWIQLSESNFSIAFGYFTPRENPKILPGQLPAFRPEYGGKIKVVQLADLPVPSVPFGLYFDSNHRLETEDGRWKELARFHTLQALSLGNHSITEEGLKDLAALKKLKHLSFFDSNIEDGHLKHLAALESLETIDFNSATRLTGVGLKDLAARSLRGVSLRNVSELNEEGLKALGTLKQLRSLLLAHFRITDAQLEHLMPLTDLQDLSLSGCSTLTDAGVRKLAGLRQLKRLHLVRTEKITGVGLKDLAGLKLEELNLNSSHVTDDGVAAAAMILTLKKLDIDYTGVTDVGLDKLAALKDLEYLKLSRRFISNAALERLQKALPKLKIRSD